MKYTLNANNQIVLASHKRKRVMIESSKELFELKMFQPKKARTWPKNVCRTSHHIVENKGNLATSSIPPIYTTKQL